MIPGIWSLLVFGITIILTKSHIMRRFRLFLDRIHPELGYMSTCPMCMGFWVGVVLCLIGTGLSGNVIYDGFISSAICTLLWSLISYYNEPTENVED